MTFKAAALPAGTIHYTVPGYQPELTPSEEDTYSEGYAFRNDFLLPTSTLQLVTWRQVLTLDGTAPDPSQCAPPPHAPPHIRASAAERQQWRRILNRWRDPEKLAAMPSAVGQMFRLLDEYQQNEVTLFGYGFSQEGL